MLYICERDILAIGIDWDETVSVIEHAVRCLERGDYAQPIKPYLRYRDLTNRIIAMPAFVGGDVNAAGLKWIASFPRNIDRQIPRAHSVVVLNDADTRRRIIRSCFETSDTSASTACGSSRHSGSAYQIDRDENLPSGFGRV